MTIFGGKRLKAVTAAKHCGGKYLEAVIDVVDFGGKKVFNLLIGRIVSGMGTFHVGSSKLKVS